MTPLPGAAGERPRLCFVGPHLGRHPGWVTTQSEVVAGLFEREGYEVHQTSSVRSPLPRLADMLATLARRRGRIDYMVLSVFSGRAFMAADLLSLYAARLGIAQIHFLHGGDLPETARRRPEWVRRVLGRAAVRVAPSRYLLRALEGLSLDGRVIPNVLDLEDYDLRIRESVPASPRLLWLRTFHNLYHPHMAVEVLCRLRSRGIDARLTLAGQDKGLEKACRRLTEARGLGEHVRFPGFLDADAKRREMGEHDLYLHTNRVDNTPVTVLEAVASGLPVVATRVGGIPDLLGDAGLLVPPQDADAMADAVERLMGSPGEVRRLSRAGRALAERSAWPRVHQKWAELFNELDEHCD